MPLVHRSDSDGRTCLDRGVQDDPHGAVVGHDHPGELAGDAVRQVVRLDVIQAGLATERHLIASPGNKGPIGFNPQNR